MFLLSSMPYLLLITLIFYAWHSKLHSRHCDNKKLQEQFERLVRALRTDGGGKESPLPKLQ